jgi:Putative DNA-binding domain
VGNKHNHATNQWHMFDCHIHTPASSDYQQPEVTYLEILQRAESRGLDIIAFMDHNTIAGYRHLQDDIQQLTLLEKLNRLVPDERLRLTEYRRLLSKMLVLPGFEFTATFGFHIIGIFPPEKPIREIEHLLLQLNIPSVQLDDGSATVGATTDVLTAYRLINEGGGLVIAAHANSSNGVAMRGFTFGGQTKIAYTQDPNLRALEVTDLEQKGPRTTAAFFNGTKPEYPRRMHCIQGSDAHRLTTDPQRKKNLGVGERATDVALPDASFDSLKELFESNDFSRTRPHRHKEEPAFDFIQAARDEGPNIIQDFHESMTIRGGKIYAIIADVCAFANTNGGTLYLGVGSEPMKVPVGISDPENAISQLDKEINNRISPPLRTTIDLQDFTNKKIIRVLVPRGENPPYAVDDNKIYVRDEAETGLAVRDEIVSLVLRGNQTLPLVSTNLPISEKSPETRTTSTSSHNIEESIPFDVSPKTGVEVLPNEERDGTRFYSMRDLRNGNIVKNVTRASARKLWHYAITEYAEIGDKIDQVSIQWQGNYGLLNKYMQGNNTHYDLIQKTATGYRFFFGVTLDGIHGPWKALAGEDEG